VQVMWPAGHALQLPGNTESSQMLDRDRLLQEVKTEAKAVGSTVKFQEFLDQSLLSSLTMEERCGAGLRLAVASEMRLRVAAAGIPRAQASRETALHQEVQELKSRLRSEQLRVTRAMEDIRRLTTATRELTSFLDVKPPQMKEAISLAVRTGWAHVNWHNQYTPLHLAAELNRMTSCRCFLQSVAIPVLVTIRGVNLLMLHWSMAGTERLRR